MAEAEKVVTLYPAKVAYKGAILPYKPPIDKIFALALLIAKSETDIEQILFHKHNECSEEDIERWKSEHLYPIDLGNQKYNRTTIPSASAFVAQDLEMELADGFAKLLEKIGENNKTGVLRHMKYSVAHMVREIYELHDDDAFHVRAIERTLDVIQMYGAIEDGQGIERELDGLEEALPDLYDKYQSSMNQPLTLGQYVRNLWLYGDDVADIRKKEEWWNDQLRRLQHHRECASRELQMILPHIEPWEVDGVRGIMLNTSNHFLAKEVTRSRQWRIRLIGDGTGHWIISATNMSLAKLAQILQKIEPGRWYYNSDMEALINGGVQYKDVPSTEIQPQKLRSMIERHVRKK